MGILTKNQLLIILMFYALAQADLQIQQVQRHQIIPNQAFPRRLMNEAQSTGISREVIGSYSFMSFNADKKLQQFAKEQKKYNYEVKHSSKISFDQNKPSDFERVGIEKKIAKTQLERAYIKGVKMHDNVKIMKGQKQDGDKSVPQASLSKSDKIKRAQYKQFKAQQQKIGEEKREFNQYIFDLDSDQAENFTIRNPIQQLIIFQVKIYTNDNGVFRDPQNVQNEGPLLISVHKTDKRLVYKKQFFFQMYGFFIGMANHTYTIAFVNKGSHKLIFFKTLVMFQHNRFQDLLQGRDVQNHADRLSTVKGQIVQRVQDMNMKFMLENENNKKLTQGVFRYYSYNICEMVLIMLCGILQVQIVQRLLTKASVV